MADRERTRMSCEEIRQMLQQRFDEGQPLAEGLEAHLDSLPECRSYLSQLQALQGALTNIPLEEPPPGLTERVRQSVAASPSSRFRPLAAVAATVLVMTVGILGWRFPVAVDVRAWLAEAELWLPRVDWKMIWSFLATQLQTVWYQATSPLANSLRLSSSTLLVGMSVMVMFLVVFNGFEAGRVRWAVTAGANGSGGR